MQQLWREGEPIEVTRLPSWLSPEYAGDYRRVRSPSTKPVASDRDRYFAELEELKATGLIVDDDPLDRHAHHVYVGAPNDHVWSIGIYAGGSPFDLAPATNAENPVLTRRDVSDCPAIAVADPFMVTTHDGWHMFFEVMNWRTWKGEIGLATSADGCRWEYVGRVIVEPYHLSYPCVFPWMGEYYMVPESSQGGSIRLYRALEFPIRWSFIGEMLTGHFVDPSIFRFEDRWWLFAETSPEGKHDTLRLYQADSLLGPWSEHPGSPIVEGDALAARPAGRPLVVDGRVVRFAQSCHPEYGTNVRGFEITELTPTTYREREVRASPLLAPRGRGWNGSGMHHIDAHLMEHGRWIACVDGRE